MQPLRQGDVLLIPTSKTVKDTKLPHLTLAEGEVMGHRHRISQDEAELYAYAGRAHNDYSSVFMVCTGSPCMSSQLT